MLASLKRAGYVLSYDVVQLPEEFEACLRKVDYDLIVSDHNLRSWTGRDALDIVHRTGRYIPFIVVTGTLGDEAAVDYLKHGATDYVLKQRLNLLPRAVSAAVQDKAHREETAQLNERIFTAKREWELTFDTVPDAVMILDRECRVQRANRATSELLQLPFSKLIGRPCYEVLHGTSQAPPSCPHQRLLNSGNAQRGDYEERRLGKTFDCTSTPRRGNDGMLAGCIHVLRDVTESKQAEAALRESEKKYREFVENATYGIFRSTPEGDLLDVNPALVAMLGYASKEEVLKLNLERDIYETRSDRVRALQELGFKETVRGFETNWRRKGRKTIIVRLSGSAVEGKEKGTKHFEWIVEDITDRRNLEEQFRQSQKMEAIGRLAGGLAHDFNNLLGVIIGYSDLALEPTPEEALLYKVQEIKKAALRAATLTRQLLAFGRKQILSPRVIDLNTVVKDCSKMLKPLLGENIELITRCAPALDHVYTDAVQIEQVIVNLTVNARDAMPKGGKVIIETANAKLDERHGQQGRNEVRPGDYVVLTVSDTGSGMDKQTQGRLFEPFFTTKEKGKGTGLGLATVYGIVKQSEAYIWVYSELNKGTTFKIYFPRVMKALDSAVRIESPCVPPGTGRVLLVEDEPALRQLTHRLLEKMGCTVLEAGDGAEAVRVAGQCNDPIDLLITDVVMPGMSGGQLAELFAATHPQMKVMYMSGHTDDVIVHHAILKEGVSFLQKPYTRDALASKIAEVLGRASVDENEDRGQADD